MENIVNIYIYMCVCVCVCVCVVHLLVWIITCTRCTVRTSEYVQPVRGQITKFFP